MQSPVIRPTLLYSTWIVKDFGENTFDATSVCEGLWVGSVSAAKSIDDLRKRNISSILTILRDIKVKYPKDFQHKVVIMADHPMEDLLGKLPDALGFLENELNNGRTVLVHCAHGISRSVAVCAAYLIVKKNMTITEALSTIKAKRPQVKPNIGFLFQLKALSSFTGNVEQARNQFQSTLYPKRSI